MDIKLKLIRKLFAIGKGAPTDKVTTVKENLHLNFGEGGNLCRRKITNVAIRQHGIKVFPTSELRNRARFRTRASTSDRGKRQTATDLESIS